LIEDIVRMCQLRIRVPEQWWGDFLAMMGAARIGERELIAFGAEVGWDLLDDFTRQWFDYSEAMMEGALRGLPAGTHVAQSIHDPFPGTAPEGVVIRAKVTARPAEGRIEVDLRDNPDCLPNGLNLSEACARTAALIGVFNSIDVGVPKNAGSFRRIDVLLRRGCITGIPEHPTSCSVATTNIADRVANAVQRAIAEMGEGFGMAEVGAVIPPSTGVISGVDPRTGKRFVNQIFLGFTGGAARWGMDAWVTYAHVGNGGMCYQDSVELDELEHPLRVETRRLMIDSEGAGRFRGAPGLLVEFTPIGTVLEVGYVSDGTVNPALGARGGGAGGRARQALRRTDGRVEELPACAQVRAEPGETIISLSTGGGGYGDPKLRDPERVRHDVREKWISLERARSVYGLA
jgi:N-methylhydantoinase B